MRKCSIIAESEMTPVGLFAALLPSVDDRPKVSRPKPPTTEEEIAAAMARAQDQGHTQGYTDGLDAGHKMGYIRGLEKGEQKAYTEGLAMQKQIAREFAAEMGAKVAQFEASLPGWFASSEAAMTDLALEAVRRVLEAELQITRASALAIVKTALREVTHATEANIRVNPFDSALLTSHRDELLAEAASLRGITFVDDPAIAGGCVIESKGGVIDARVETKLQLIENHLEEAA